MRQFFVLVFLLFLGCPALMAQNESIQPIPRDTSFTPYSAWMKIKKEFPQAQIVRPVLPSGVVEQRDIVYATLPETAYGKRELHLDLFRPAKPGVYPVLLLVHGGGWRSGNKSMDIPLAQQIAAKGYVTAAIEYRLSMEALYPAAVYDIKAAVRYLRANAKKYQIDAKRIAICGTSAGGQLAALVGASCGVQKLEGNEGNAGVSSCVQAIIDIDGVLDFNTPDEKGKDEEAAKRSSGTFWFGVTFYQAPEKWIEASAIQYVGKNTPPMLFVNSALPRFHFGRDSVIAILNKHKIYTEVHTIENTPHPFWLFHPWFEPTVNYTIAFLDRTFKKQRK
jgi:acetyl esterase/lipase